MSELRLYNLLRESLVWVECAGQDALAKHDLTLAQYDALRFLAEQDGQRIGELRLRLLVDHSKMTRIADRLVTLGLVDRQPDATDRRSWRLYLTPAGHTLLSQATATHNQLITDQFALFSPPEQQQLIELLNRLNQKMAREYAF